MRLRLLLTATILVSLAFALSAADIPAPRAVLSLAPSPRVVPVRDVGAAPMPRNYDLLPPRHQIAPLIDFHIDAGLADAGVTPAEQADDATLVRRLTLDLVGRIPTTAEADAYVKSTDPDKRAKLVDRLIALAGVRAAPGEPVRRDAQPRRRSPRRRGASRVPRRAPSHEHKPWDRIFRELMLPDETDPTQKGAAEFLRGRVADADKLTNDVSVAFFGVNVSCAQCHDHPLVADWTQDHFYGMKIVPGPHLRRRRLRSASAASGSIKYKPTQGAGTDRRG